MRIRGVGGKVYYEGECRDGNRPLGNQVTLREERVEEYDAGAGKGAERYLYERFPAIRSEGSVSLSERLMEASVITLDSHTPSDDLLLLSLAESCETYRKRSVSVEL